VRTYLEAELYERVLREAAVQRCSVSECIHDALEELYAIRDELSRPLQVAPGEGPEGGPLVHRLIAQLEERIAGAFSRQLDEIQALAKGLRRLEVMTDREYVSLMLFLPGFAEEEADERAANAKDRYQTWRQAVDKILASKGGRR
jgi:Arc/MetJ family transcription regulator